MASTGREQFANEEDMQQIFSLPRERGLTSSYLYLFQEFWCPGVAVQGAYNFQKYFQAKDSDVFVTSFPKTGTTWLIALTFAIANRQHFSSLENHPLLTSNPHELVRSLEFKIFANDIYGQNPSLSNMTEPRLFSTHIPFTSLPKSIIKSNCKIIYISRNPFDTFISAWAYFNKIKLVSSSPTLALEEAFEMYCNGIMAFGPWWSHMLGYWKGHIDRPNNVLFLKYEDLKEDINLHVKRIGEFLGCSFIEEEENNGVIERIIKLCSFEKMKDLEVNTYGKVDKIVENKFFFRKAETGDWVNYFSPSMIERLSKIIKEKLSGSGLSFKCILQTTK